MMKKLLFFIASVFILSVPLSVLAQVTTVGGGTGSTSPSGILNGVTGNLHLQTLKIGTGLIFDGTTLAASGGSSASSTLLIDSNTFSGTVNKFTNAPAVGVSGLLKGNGSNAITAAVNGTDFTLITALTCAGSQFLNAVTAAGGFTCGTPAGTTYTGTYPIIVTGSVISSGFGTTTTWGMGNNGFVVTGATGIPFVAASSTLNLPNSALQNSSLTVNGQSISLGGSGTVTANTTNAVTFNSSGSGGSSPQVFNGSSAETISYNTIGAQVAGTYVTGVTATAPIFSSGGTTPNLTWAGLATTSQPASSNLLTSNGAAGVYGTATSTLSATTPLTGSFTQIGSGGALGCQAASGSQAGCLSSADWNTFNGKQAAGNYITALTGDITASGPGSAATTLATVNGNVGSFTNANITVNGKGLITAAANGTAGLTADPNWLIDAAKYLSATTTNSYGINTNAQGQTFGYAIGDSLLAYASSTNLSTIFGLGAGGQNATTSATVASTTAFGFMAGNAITTALNNTLIGAGAGSSQTTAGGKNTVIGSGAYENGTGSSNIAIGYNVAAGQAAGNNNTVIGNGVQFDGSTPSTRLDIGNLIYGSGIYSNGTTPSSAPVTSGKIGIATSSSGTLLSSLVVGGNQSIGADYQFAAPSNGLIIEGNTGVGTTSPFKAFSVGGDEVIGASTAGGTLGNLYISTLGTAAGTFLAADPTGKIIATSTPSGSNSAFSPAANYATVAGLPAYGYLTGVITEVGTGALSVDGNNPTVGQRVLVKNESGACSSSAGACNNGLYDVTAAGSGIAAFVLTRDAAYNSSSNVIPGIVTYVISGATLADDFWAMTSASPITIGVTSLNYTEVSGGGSSISSLGPLNQLQTGATQTLATTTSSFNGLTVGLTITASGNTQTFQPTLSGTLGLGGGGTNATSFTTSGNSVYYNGSALVTALSTLSVTTPFASSTVLSTTQGAFFATSGGSVGVASTTPFSRFSVGTGLASSSITVAEYKYGITGNVATSTAANIDCNASTQIAWPIGTSASTLTLINMTPGKKCIVVVQNPNNTAGAITWAVQSNAILKWAGGTIPTQTTTANTFDIWSFLATQGSSTMEIIGAATLNN